MSELHESASSAEDRASALDVGRRFDSQKMTDAEHEAVVAAGEQLAEYAGGIWILISGEFTSDDHEVGTEGQIREMLYRAFDYPGDRPHPGLRLNVLLDSPGGSLDSAYTTALYLSAYSGDVRVFVPGRAKSASTLLAIGADRLYLSVFGELGPLDTQLPDPRNPANHLSALDCYQSVDYVRDFGIRTMKEMLPTLISKTGRRISVSDLLQRSQDFAIGAIGPMLHSVSALDFGGWGRSLRIGEYYAKRLLSNRVEGVDSDLVSDIARQLVFNYTHHLFPIDYHEARRINLPVELMDEEVYDRADEVVRCCRRKNYVNFMSEEQRNKMPASYQASKSFSREFLDGGAGMSERTQAQAGRARRARSQPPPPPPPPPPSPRLRKKQ
ncbi:SDH family Clp fold serine proteinase [Streptomyces glaucus]|uniref:Serine dehydrogenase proteinase n=1 Tax=Streptomyces glaucus TaxID=284029 RepID=A0ABN3J6N9_9ACTN